jgi:hypothetical protein
VTNSATYIADIITPYEMAVNSVTNKVYIATSGLGNDMANLAVVDGAHTAISTALSALPSSMAVNSVTNQAFMGVDSAYWFSMLPWAARLL